MEASECSKHSLESQKGLTNYLELYFVLVFTGEYNRQEGFLILDYLLFNISHSESQAHGNNRNGYVHKKHELCVIVVIDN